MKLIQGSLAPVFLAFASVVFPVTSKAQDSSAPIQIETKYDAARNATTVRLLPVQISGEKAQYQSVQISPSFSYPGQTFRKPDFLDFEVQTVVKTKLKIDLYVVFLVDGETIFLSSNRSALKRPGPGKRWIAERLVFRMPYETLRKLSKAKTVEIKLDSVRFPLTASVLDQIREFALRVEGE